MPPENTPPAPELLIGAARSATVPPVRLVESSWSISAGDWNGGADGEVDIRRDLGAHAEFCEAVVEVLEVELFDWAVLVGLLRGLG